MSRTLWALGRRGGVKLSGEGSVAGPACPRENICKRNARARASDSHVPALAQGPLLMEPEQSLVLGEPGWVPGLHSALASCSMGACATLGWEDTEPQVAQG